MQNDVADVAATSTTEFTTETGHDHTGRQIRAEQG
jgi:hypothetical protein